MPVRSARTSSEATSFRSLATIFVAGSIAFACGGATDGSGGLFGSSSGGQGSSSGAGSSSGSSGSSSGVSGSSSGAGGSSSGGSSSGGNSSGGSSSGAGGSSSGGSSSGGNSSGGSSSGAGSSGGSSSGTLPPGCPASPPANGAPCSGTTSCQYGNDQDSACDVISVCESDIWESSGPQGAPFCPTRAPGADSCPGAEPAPGSSCDVNVACGYPQGLCICSAVFTFGPTPGGSGDSDAGLVWQCESPGPGCPEPRPAPGDPCTEQGQSCDYGDCEFPGGPIVMECNGSAWTAEPALCAE